MADFKPIPFEAIMLLTEAGIADRFPRGAVEEKKRWRPARTKKEADKTLFRLLAEKRKRVHGKRLMGKTHGYTENPAFALRTVPDAGEAVDAISQGDFTKEAKERFASLRSEDLSRVLLRSYMARIRDLAIQRIKAGEDPSPIFETALAELAKEDDRKAA